ncbi:MAG: VanW family protein, partial [Thermoleophilia bacterium]|nr:VanW family protein [Thermoleophilia bacterium]
EEKLLRAPRFERRGGEIRPRVSAAVPRRPAAGTASRVVNIAVAARTLDGTIIPAGGRFSLNEALGGRTPERGFVPAPQINAGRLEDAVGGGVSQGRRRRCSTPRSSPG